MEYFLSGHAFPLDMLPPWIAGIVKWSPFPYELYFPVKVFMERIRVAAGITDQKVRSSWALNTGGYGNFGEEQRALKSWQPGLFEELPES